VLFRSYRHPTRNKQK